MKQATREETQAEDASGTLGKERLDRARESATAKLHELAEDNRKSAVAGGNAKVLEVVEILKLVGVPVAKNDPGGSAASSSDTPPALPQPLPAEDCDSDDENAGRTMDSGAFFKAQPTVRKASNGQRPNMNTGPAQDNKKATGHAPTR